MAKDQAGPAPFDVVLNAVGYMLAEDAQGNPLFVEEAPQAQEPAGEQTQTWRDWSGGIGVRRDLGDEATRHTLASVDADGVGGGIDSGFGCLMKGPELTVTALSGMSGKKGRRFVGPFGGNYYAAYSTKLLVSTSPIFASGVSTVATLASNIRDLTLFQGTNSVNLLEICQQYGAIWTYNGITPTDITVDGAAAGRTMDPKSVIFTQDVGVNYVDATSVVTGAGNQAIGGWDTLANGDWILIGGDRPFIQAIVTMTATLNGTASVLAAHYWSGSAWVAVTGLTDGTAAGGGTITFGQSGTIAWTRPAASWPKAPLTTAVSTGAATGVTTNTAGYHWIRLTVSVVLDSAEIDTIALGWQAEADAVCVVGNRLNYAWDQNKIRYTTNGGDTPTLNESASPIGTYAGNIVGLAGANATPYLIRDTDFGANNDDGTSTSFLPDLARPPSQGYDDQGYCSWLNLIFFSHDYVLYQWDPVQGDIQTIGPERLMLNEDIQVRSTALIGDRTHALYGACYSDAVGSSWLARWGGYRQLLNPESGTVEWTRLDAWFPICKLGSRKIYGMGTWTASGITYLVMGDDDGNCLSLRLPTQSSYVGDSQARFNIVPSYAILPLYMGQDPSQPIAPFAFAIQGKGVTSAQTVTLQTRAPGATSWVAQGTIDDTNFSNGGGRCTFATLTEAAGVGSYGVEMRLKLVTASASPATPLQVDTFSLFYEQPARQKRIYRITVLADDYVTAQNGRALGYTAADWVAVTNTAASTKQPMTLVRPNGATESVLVRSRRDRILATGPRRTRRRAIDLVVATAQ